MHRFLDGIEAQHPDRRLHRLVHRADLDLVGQQADERFERDLTEALAFGDEPLFERRLRDPEALEEIPAIQARRPLERLGDFPH